VKDKKKLVNIDYLFTLNRMRTIENIKDPEQVEKAIKEDVDKIKVLNK